MTYLPVERDLIWGQQTGISNPIICSLKLILDSADKWKNDNYALGQVTATEKNLVS